MLEIPILPMIRIGPLMIHTWGLFVALGIIIAYVLAKKQFRKRGVALFHLDALFTRAVIAGFVGARVLWVLIDYETYLLDPIEVLKIWNGGLAFTGGFIFALLAIVVYSRRAKITLWHITDALAIPLAVGMLIGRFGCLFTGLHPGIPTTSGVVYRLDDVLVLAWPFWAIISWLTALVILFIIEKRGAKTGVLTLTAIAWWGGWRFFGDFLRADASIPGGDPKIALLTPTQYIAFVALCAAIYFLLKTTAKRKSKTDERASK